ncbi:cryptochrome/photolyase family protein [Hyphomicrobium sp.]|uniref:cryptochrome/photolyase family protein n=1 Tax=Hyphomicrobium sp. TaxID=82 RepID=UPI000F99D22A|nr:cryptochrome/photolyase family protein [Hyphomicrobium sp.]RUP00596.1 MAG: cryptochrome/photolyase family protein [Hyphomicrobium sp.]
MTVTLRLVLGDQLSETIASLRGIDAANDVVLMAEVKAEGTYVPHHPQKLVFFLAAMRCFAQSLRSRGIRVRYVTLDDAQNTHTLIGEVRRAVHEEKPRRVLATWPGEWRVLDMLTKLKASLHIPFDLLEDDRYFCSLPQFREWAGNRKQLRMEYFYREMRQKTGLLMRGVKTPDGGRWNFDASNREPFAGGPLALPEAPRAHHKANTAEAVETVKEAVARHFPNHFGSIEDFRWAVDREGALRALDHFISDRLPEFGRYQDAMVTGSDTMFHSLLSPYLNVGLLGPEEVCRAAESAYRDGRAPIESVEGFIRQILGWREYVRGIYWLFMPDYAKHNFFHARRRLPDFYWDETKTEMACLRECIGATRRNAYAHHIQRLMVTGNFALLSGVHVKEVTDWYLSVYADAVEWVELPNTLGMSLFADGGLMASKPYAAGGRYIDKMSDYCTNCRYRPDRRTGENACPFTMLYWDFMIRNSGQLAMIARLKPILAQIKTMSLATRAEIQSQAQEFLDRVAPVMKSG